jgi:predicted nucleic acid-binding protein
LFLKHTSGDSTHRYFIFHKKNCFFAPRQGFSEKAPSDSRKRRFSFPVSDGGEAVIYYLDSSALVKRYYAEKGSSWTHSLFRADNILVVSKVTYAEFLAALARKKREGEVTEKNFRGAVDNFLREWKELVVVEVTDAVFTDLLSLVTRHSLRGFDAIHLCSALWFHKRTKAQVIFVCSDQTLLGAARGEGLDIRDPEEEEGKS